MSDRRALVPGIELVRSGRWVTGLAALLLFAHAIVCGVGVIWGVLVASPGTPHILGVTPLPTNTWEVNLWGAFPGQLPAAEAEGTTFAVEVGADGTSVERLDAVIPASRWIATRGFRIDLGLALVGLALSILLDWLLARPRLRSQLQGGSS